MRRSPSAGRPGARAAEAAALATRRAKDPRGRRGARSSASGAARAEELGFGGRSSRAVGRAPARRSRRRARVGEAIAERLAGPDGLTRALGDVRARRGHAGAVRGAAARRDASMRTTLEAAAERFLDDARGAAGARTRRRARPGEAFRRRDGRLMPARADRLRYSTAEHLALERAARRSCDGRARRRRRRRERRGRRAVRRDAADAVGRAAAGGRVAVPRRARRRGRRRAGRDRARRSRSGLRARRGRRPGCPVLGVAVARRAAASCGRAPGSRARASPRSWATSTRGERLPARCVLVVDEAGMVPTRRARGAARPRRARVSGKVVLVGDDRQLPAIEAGGAFRGLIQRGLAVELGENVRQVNVVGARGARSPSRRPCGRGARALRRARGAGRRADGD